MGACNTSCPPKRADFRYVPGGSECDVQSILAETDAAEPKCAIFLHLSVGCTDRTAFDLVEDKRHAAELWAHSISGSASLQACSAPA